MKKLQQWAEKWAFLLCLLVMGIVYFSWTDNWQVYADPLRQGADFLEMQYRSLRGDSADAPVPEDGTVSGDTVSATNTVSGDELTVSGDDVQTGESEATTETGTDASGEPTESVPEESPKPVWRTVDDSYFDDAVFIGDSRTVGMYEYGGLEETSTFYASTGLTVYKMFDAQIVPVPGQKKKITVEEALSERQFAKIYLMIGINEMGTGTVESFMKTYTEAVEHLQELQPDAVIYLQAIMKVTAERSAQGDYITNEGIEARNEEIAKLADDEKIFFLDVNPLICDETGGMVADYTYDGVHLKAQYIPIWLNFLKEHAVTFS